MQKKQTLSQELASIYSRVSLECKTYIDSDPLVTRQDTCKGLLALLQQLKTILTSVNLMKVEERAQNYHITYNTITYIIDISEYLRKTNFSLEIVSILIDSIKSMQENLILNDVKYLDKRTDLYLKVSKIYEEWEFYQEAVNLLDSALKSYKNMKTIHQLDPPVPTYITAVLNNNIKLIKVFFIKYSIQAGSFPPADWKKKVDEEFGDDNEAKLMCLIETLKTQTKKHANIFTKNMKNYKQILLQSGYQMIKGHLQVIAKGLNQQKQKIQRQVTFRGNMSATQQDINEQIKKKREIQEKYVKQSELKKASQSIPLQYHAQLIHYALQIKSHKILTQLIQSAKIRIQCRRIEVPYVNDIMIVVSNSPFPNIPNGYTKIPTDLNEANMMKQLIKLRKSGKKPPEDEVLKAPSNAPQVAGKQDKKDSKKGGKEVPSQPPPVKQNDNSRQPTQWQLNEIKHKYVYMMIKKSMSPQNALYDVGIVLGNQQNGPVGYIDNRRIIVPYIQQNMKIMESQINQHTGVRQTTGLVPYIILYHSRNSLESEDQKKTVITDVCPLIGKNPMMPAKWGYKKIDTDLRQVPIEFIKAPNHDYVYLTFKTDQLFHISQRHIQIIKAFVDLQSTYGQKKGSNTEQQKYIELELNYDIDKLDLFFQNVQQALKGQLGREYYQKKSDFLTNLTLQIWTKYLKNPLLQFDFVRQQRLNEQIIDYDYNYYKTILQKSSSIFLRGLKVMNLIMVSNPKGDILLQSKINLELSKLLEQTKFYKAASDNIKLCLDKLRKYRDQYLSKGVEGINDRILPFSITCSNSKINSTLESMRKKYFDQRRFLQKILRIKDRQQKGIKPLSPEQLDEQQKQHIRLRKPDTFDQIVQKINPSHSQVFAIICAIEIDLLNIYFRVCLKRSEQHSKLQGSKNDMTNGIKNTQLDGLATTMKQKLNLSNGPTQTKNQKNLNQLQNTLVKANQLPTPKPRLEKMQNKLIAQNKKNPYNMALLMINLAAMNSENKDKRYYLQQALNYLQACKELQKQMLVKAIQNSIFIFSGLWDNKINEDQNSQKISPFKDLYNHIWQNQTVVPQPPILISKNSTSIHLKLPPYIPKKRHQKQQTRHVKYMSIYGKPSANGVDVSLNCTELEGTGIRKEIGKTVKVSSLSANNVYCFAAAGVDQNEQILGIGKTGQDIGTFNPLSISMIASYLAKVSYQINQYQIAQKAVKIVLAQFCEQGTYITTNQRSNNLYFYTINESKIKGVSLIEIKSISQSFYIAALCQRRKLKQMQQNEPNKPKIIFEEKEKFITNLLVLSASLSPSLSSPNMSIPFLIPQNEVLLRGIVINMIPQKWMNPRIRKLGVNVMQKLLKWGLENNQISLSRKLAYKWNQRKYLIMGKMIQIQQKKEVKKGAKQSKEQEVKLIDKYCRIMIEKTPQMMDAFEDSMIMVSEQYYDFVSAFIERAKEQINTLGQCVDNPTQQLDALNNHLNLKLQLVEYLKEPMQSIKKIANTSPYYLQYNSKILKKALQMASQADYKVLLTKSEELDIPQITEELKLSKEIYQLIFSAIKQDIAWNPTSKLQLIQFQKNTGKDLNKSIQIFTSWQQKKTQLFQKLSKSLTLQQKYKDFDYLNMWISELSHQKAQCHVITSCNQFNVKRKIKGRYDKVKNMNLEDLFKKQKEVLVIQDKSYSYSEEQLKKLTQILSYLSQSVYSSLVIQNWLKLESVLKFVCNLLCYIEITPFYHKGSPIWTYFAFISLCAIEMLTRIKKNGFGQFRRRYSQKVMNTERVNINEKLQLGDIQIQPLIEPFNAEYYQPDLDTNTTKSFWFLSVKELDIEAISNIIAYTVNTLRLENKHNLVINIVRDFCNITQHYVSLNILPFMANSQTKLLQDVQKLIQQQYSELLQIQNAYNAQKSKLGKKRTYLMSGQKMQFEKVFEENSQKINSSLSFLNNQKKYIDNQITKSNRIKDEIARDTSKQVLAQQQQKKYTIEFGEDYEQMYRKFGEEAKHVKKSKNFIKDIINKYDAIYNQLKNNKTSKDTLAEIQNRNQVGNLWFATGHLEKAFEFWNDSLATIFKKVNPIDNYHEILAQNKPFLVKNIGEKQTIMALCLLYKISNFTCGHQLQTQKSSIHFACHLVFSLFQTSLNYPQTYQMYKEFRMKSFASKEIFSDQNSVNLTQLLSALEYFILKNIYDQNSLSALPLAVFYQYLGTDIVKNAQISIKAKIYKSILLSQSGFISQSMNYLIKVANEKDLPMLWLDSSDFLKKEKGMNWVQQSLTFNNSQFWTQPDNKAIIQQFKKITMKPQTAITNGIINPILFNFAKSLVLYKIHQSQLSKDQVLNDQRLQILNEVQASMRQSLKKCSILQQFYTLLQQLETAQLNYKQNQVSDQLKKQMETCKIKMIQYLKKNSIEETAIKIYQKQESNSLNRANRLQFMLKIRFTLHRISQSRNLLTNSFYILKNGLSNMQRYAFGARVCQTGYDPEIKTVALTSAPQAGKKDDKKGGKKEQQSAQVVAPIAIDYQKQKQIRQKTQSKPNRTALNAFWHIKILFQLGKLLFKQNNIRESLKLFEVLIQNSKKYQQEYYSILSRGFIVRCKLRLGNFEPQQFKEIISIMEKKHFYDLNYIALVMDFGQLLSGDSSCLQFMEKGKQFTQNIWKKYGMTSILNGIGQNAAPKNYYLRQEASAQQQEFIKKKKKGEKKAGKDDKKAPPKKEDPKKKKEQSKVQFKITPLSKIVQVNLLEEEKYIFGQYNLTPHPNYRKNNIYQPFALLYIKTYLRLFYQEISLNKQKSYVEETEYILKLVHVIESYSICTDHIKIVLYSCLGKVFKNNFILQLSKMIKETKHNYLQLVKTPFEDLPLNKYLINIPAYSEFLAQNRKLLLNAKTYFKKCLTLIQNSTIFYERCFNIEEIAWQYADNQCLLAQYIGREKPKFYPQDQLAINPDEVTLQSLNNMSESLGFLEFSIKMRTIKFQLSRNYLQIGGKGLDPTAKIDEDINSQIMEMDKQGKKKYPQFLIDSFKGKGPINGTDLITYMLKIYREAQFMTYTNPSYQNLLFKCNRILAKFLPGYKQKCLISSLEVPLKKNIKDKFVQTETIIIKSVKKGQNQTFLYVLGPLAQGEDIYYGRITIELHKLSKITEDLLKLTTKTSISDKRSEAVKNRDYILHKQQFKRILIQLSVRFGNPVNDGNIKPIADELLPQLKEDNLKTINKLLDTNGLSTKNKQICKYLRKLHEIKYQ